MHISSLTLQTANLPELLQFYTNTLGLPLLSAGSTKFAVQAGDTVLHFETAAAGTEPYYHFAFNIPENQLHEALEWLRERVDVLKADGSEIVNFPNWNAHSLYFFDPAGNVVELIARQSLLNASEIPFSAKSLLCISEIGLPVNETEEIAEKLRTQLQLSYFNNSRFPDFNALGDDNGLLLVVTQNRNWYPTQKQSRTHPVRVEVQASGAVNLPEYSYQLLGTSG